MKNIVKKATLRPRFGLMVARGRKVAHLISWTTFRPRIREMESPERVKIQKVKNMINKNIGIL